MKSSDDNIINLNEVFFSVLKTIVILILLFITLRLPLVWVKIPLAIGVLFLGWCWIFRAKKKSTPARRPGQRRPSATRSSRPEKTIVQRLIAHDAAGEFGKAKTLIQSLDGEVFPEATAQELATIAGNYFPVEIEPTETGFKFKLV